jgi:4-hydroxybenzoate polyprenyltransferase
MNRFVFAIYRKLFPILKLVRIWNLVLLVVIELGVGYSLGAENESMAHLIVSKKLWLLILSLVAGAGAGYVINDYYDQKADRINVPGRVVIGNDLTRRRALLLHTILNLASLSFATLLGWKVVVFVGTGIMLLWVYCNSLKRQPLIGNITLGILAGGLVYAPALVFKEPSLKVAAFALYAFWVFTIRSLLKDSRDRKGEERFGAKTFPILYGLKRTKDILALLFFGFCTSLYFTAGIIGGGVGWYMVVLLPFIAYTIHSSIQADTRAKLQTAILLCKILILLGMAGLYI